jgi:hypothetical protein
LFSSGASNSPCPGGTAASEGSDTDTVSVTCTINNANRNDVYTAFSAHTVVAYVTDYQEGVNDSKYYDNDGYESFGPLDESTTYGDWYDPPYMVYHTTLQRLPLGHTTASDSTGTRSACGDVRDQLINEYIVSPGTTFTMITCSDFVASTGYTSPGGFTFLQLAPTQTTGHGVYAVLQSYMANNLRTVFNTLGNSPGINSGYRNPALEKTMGKYYPNSRHMAGDAADLSAGSTSTYNLQRSAGLSAGGCVEPVDTKNGPQYNYADTHIDWRTKAASIGHIAGPSSCPPKWH